MTTATEKRDKWFTNYQEIPGVRGGKRKLADRDGGFDAADFKGKSVLDLGCNLGQMSLFAAAQGAASVLGVEYDTDAFLEARAIRDQQSDSIVRYKLDELDNPLFWHHVEPHDTVLLLSVIDTQELANRFGILSRACMKCKGTLYLEGHRNQLRSKYLQYLLDYTDFTQVEHVGRYGGRDLFRCSRDVLDAEGFHENLAAACKRYNRIAVVGNQLAGKSTLRRRTSVPGFTVLDDCDDIQRINSCERLILFDYRAAIYANDFEVVFHVLQPPERFEMVRKNARPLRSSGIAHSDTLRCLYTVRTH
jgi:SAM-dependent methyltransferase